MVDGDSDGKFYVNVCGGLDKCGPGNSACVEKQGTMEPIAAVKTQEIIINGACVVRVHAVCCACVYMLVCVVCTCSVCVSIFPLTLCLVHRLLDGDTNELHFGHKAHCGYC